MRISEVATPVGVTARAVRHYHHPGLLPELGPGLEEVRDVLADTGSRDLTEVLEELDADPARQEAMTRRRRTRPTPLQVQVPVQTGSLSPYGPVSPELTDLPAVLGAVDDSPTAAKDRELPAFLDATGPPETRVALRATRHGMRRRAGELHGLLNGRDDRQPYDPQVSRAAAALEALLPDAPATRVPGTGARGPTDILSSDLAPAQAAAVLRALELVKRRQEESP